MLVHRFLIGHWKRHVQEDVRDLRAIQDLQSLRVLLDLLPERVGSILSINALHEDLNVAYATVRDWILLLEALYHCFLVRPYAGKMKRALKAEPKLFLYDILQIEDPAKRLENLTALHLLKSCHFWTDSAQGVFDLRFVRNKEKEEVDFLVLRDKKPWLLLECKSNEVEIHPSLEKFAKLLSVKTSIQLVSKKNYHRSYPQRNVQVMDYERFFSSWC